MKTQFFKQTGKKIKQNNPTNKTSQTQNRNVNNTNQNQNRQIHKTKLPNNMEYNTKQIEKRQKGQGHLQTCDK